MLDLFKLSISRQQNAPLASFSLFHGSRDRMRMESKFRLWETRYIAANRQWIDREHDLIDTHSYIVHVDGSGGSYVRQKDQQWLGTIVKGTSRAAIWSFCEALLTGSDPYSGGAPQLCGIWRIDNGRHFGFVWKGKRYLAGAEVLAGSTFSAVDWFNDLFERCDGETGLRLSEAQVHDKPS